MTDSTIPETSSKFTSEQRQVLGKVYATILRWNREDDLLREKQTSPNSIDPNPTTNKNANQVGIPGKE
jgi:hypothetical protein